MQPLSGNLLTYQGNINRHAYVVYCIEAHCRANKPADITNLKTMKHWSFPGASAAMAIGVIAMAAVVDHTIVVRMMTIHGFDSIYVPLFEHNDLHFCMLRFVRTCLCVGEPGENDALVQRDAGHQSHLFFQRKPSA
jgi:hypothetical protein